MQFCPNCGKEVQADAAFCYSCGYNLRQASQVKQSSISHESGMTDHNDYSGLIFLIFLILVIIVVVAVPIVPSEDCTKFLGIKVTCHTDYVTILQYLLKQTQ